MEVAWPRPERRRWSRRLGLAGVLLLVLVGCSERPYAPELRQDEATYVNRQEGFRFDAPPGWSQHARIAEGLPADAMSQERLLVKYKRLGSPRPAFFRASAYDLPADKSPVAYVAERPPGPENWTRTGKEETVDVGGQPGTRVTFHGNWDTDKVTKEVVAVRRGNGRVIFFTGIYPTADTQARQQIRTALASVVWENGSGAGAGR